MGALIGKLTPHQRVDMIQVGLNPLNDEHIQKYLAGHRKADVNENVERVKAIMGEKLNVGLGHANERDTIPSPGEYDNISMVTGGVPASTNTQAEYRKALQQDMDDYVATPPTPSGLMNLRETPAPRQQKTNLNEAVSLGNDLAVNYFNTFIKSLQNPSTTANVAVYKALKSLLEQESKYKGTSAQEAFRKSVIGVTQQMYKQLKG